MKTPHHWDRLGKGRRCKHGKLNFWACGICRRELIAEIQAELPAGETIVRTVYKEQPEPPQKCLEHSPFGYTCQLDVHHEGKHFGTVFWKTDQQLKG